MQGHKPAIGAALEYTQKVLGGPVQETTQILATLATPPTEIKGNGDRVGLVIINLGSTDVYVSLESIVGTSNGIYLPAGGATMTLTVSEDFTLTSRTWWVASPSGPGAIYVIEYSRFSDVPTELQNAR